MADFQTDKAKSFLSRVLPVQSLESFESPASAAESLIPARPLPSEHQQATENAAKKLATREEMTPPERFALEAIIIPDKRPAIDIVNGDYTIVHPLWTHFASDPIKARIRKAIPSIGRIELPHHPTLPYGGTGFIVGRNLLMTNRHVAEIFSSGLGVRNLIFRAGQGAAIDFLRENGNPQSYQVAVREIAMIHPYWDMALLRVEGLDAAHAPLELSLQHPEDLAGRDIAVIGYPAFDPRNDAGVQNTVFGGVYYVKRLQPGKLNGRASIDSFGNNVSAATHDSSTLGGNSGSAVLDVTSGQIVGLHFAGIYLESNYAVPTAELARDGRVVDAGLNFQPSATAEAGVWKQSWDATEPTEASVSPVPAVSNAPAVVPNPAGGGPSVHAATLTAGDGSTWTIPIEISVRVGATSPNSAPPARSEAASARKPRDGSALRKGPLTFRDHFVSLYQSAAAEIARTKAAASTESTIGDDGAGYVLAAERVAQLHAADLTDSHTGAASPREEGLALEAMSGIDHAGACASLAWQLLQAKLSGDTATANHVEAQLTGSTCDPLWAKTIEEYVKYFGPSGTRREPIYVTPEKVGPKVITIKSGAKIGIIGDWGTGADPAQHVLRQVKEQQPDVLIHLGDIYYSGTESECHANFETIVNQMFDRANTHLPVYTLAGNHDMYCGGVGYYELIKRLNAPPMTQPASFFCLRTEDQSWQLLAMDTGRHDYSPFSVTDVTTFVEPAEQEWHRQRLQEFNGKTVLLSHHQLFSAFSQIGKPAANGKLRAYNPQLQATYEQFRATGRHIAAWLWGHEHNLCIYQPYNTLERGRCVGHSAIPVFGADTPYDTLANIQNPPQIIPNTMLSIVEEFYTHGFAMLKLGPAGTGTAEYFEDVGGKARRLHAEQL